MVIRHDLLKQSLSQKKIISIDRKGISNAVTILDLRSIKQATGLDLVMYRKISYLFELILEDNQLYWLLLRGKSFGCIGTCI